ncbi:MAG: hypothetical protein ACTH8P_21170, partial [Ewingella sp.]|uniref:hypothetical protein n=1 Tax=Ewingella sp. TaxID=1897459 RepID=UPI003F939742
SRSWASAHTDQGRRKRASLGTLRFFFCEFEAAQGWNGHVSGTLVIVAKCRRLGGSLAAGFQPAKKDSRFSTSCSASLLNATYWHLLRAVSFTKNLKFTEKVRLKCLKTAVKNGAEREVRDLWLESRGEGTA